MINVLNKGNSKVDLRINMQKTNILYKMAAPVEEPKLHYEAVIAVNKLKYFG